MRSRNRRATKAETTPVKGRGRGKAPMPGLLDYARELAPGRRKAKPEPAPEPEPKRRGRPRKEVVVEAPPEPKRRGRPAKVEVVEEPKARRGAAKPTLVEAVPKRQGRAPKAPVPVEEPKPASRRGRAKAAPEPEIIEEVIEVVEPEEELPRVQRVSRDTPASKHQVIFERVRLEQGHDPVDIQPGDLVEYWDKDNGGRYTQEVSGLVGKAVELAPLIAVIGNTQHVLYPKTHLAVGRIARVLRLKRGQVTTNVLRGRYDDGE